MNCSVTPLALAVITAVSSVVTDDTVAVNWTLLYPAATVTLPGSLTLALLSDRVTAIPPLGAAPLRVTVQEDVPGAFTVAGVQDRPLKVTGGGGWMTVIVPAVPEAGIEAPAPVVAETLLSVTGTLVLVVPAAIVKAAVATSPFPIVAVFNPITMHVMNPLHSEHCMLLLATEAAEPMVTETLLMSVEYPMVHCRAAGWAPPVADMDRLSVTVDPGVPVPELSDNKTCCPLAWFVIRPKRMAQIATRTNPLDNQGRFS